MSAKAEQSADTRIPLTTSDPLGERMEVLRDLVPEAFVEGEIDFDRLRQALGDSVAEGRERYGLSWAGKADAIRAIQAPSAGTLVPVPEESVNFETTENLFIEGDNLEVLKLLQKSYYGKVKMVYIDPPYNTGNEFIYPDNFKEGLEDYLRYSGQVGEGGVKLSTNTETSGRYHSKWLNMMFPRLFLARNLLRDDGVVCVSIDDHEAHNLRDLLDEVFGEDNFVACVVWQHSVQPKGYLGTFSVHHNYIFIYQKSDRFSLSALPRTEEHNKNYSNPDDDPRGRWRSGDVRNALYRPNLIYDIITPSGKSIEPPPNGWRWSRSTVQKKIERGEIVFSDDETRIIRKIYLADQEGRAPETLWFGKDVGTTREASRELKDLFGGEVPFDTAKPSRLIRTMLSIAGVGDKDLVLDFFAGSGTTAHAVLDANRDDGGSRRFLMVQLPEQVREDTVAAKMGLSTVAAIGLDRIRRKCEALQRERRESLIGGPAEQDEDLGVRSFRLTSSNFKIWEPTVSSEGTEALANQLRLFADHALPDRSEQDILYELMLKAGLSLTATIEEKSVAGLTAYSIAEGMLLICLADEVTQDALRGMTKLAPQRVVCLDAAFKGNDQLKTNTVLEMRSHDIEFRTV